MRTLLATLVVSIACSALCAETVLAKLHPGKEEKRVAERWFEKLPEYVVSQIKINKFPQVYATNPADPKAPLRLEMYDVDKSGTKFRYYVLVRNGTDANGRATFVRSAKTEWMEFSKLEPRFLAYWYPVKGNPDDADVVAFAAWLYSKKANEQANTVLTVLWNAKQDLRANIEEWIIEKEGWKVAPGQLEVFNLWDIMFQLERDILVHKDLKDKLLGEREKAAKEEYADIVKVRGNYDKRQRPPRKPAPQQQLILIDWRVKEFKRIYGGSEFFKGKDVEKTLTSIQDSITDDLQAIADLKKQANEVKGSDGKPDLKKRAETLDLAGTLDPEDLALCADIASAWVAWANIAPHGNSCDHNEGCKRAIPYYERILRYYPENTSFLLWLGKCYQAQENGEAKKYYKRIIEICGKDKGDGKIAAALMDNMDQKDAARQKQPSK